MNLKQKLALAGAGVVAVAGAGAALAETGHQNKVVARSVGTFVAGRFAHGGWSAMGPVGRMHGGDDFAAAASYLGLTTTELQTDLHSGKTLAQVADATSGKSASGLIAALVAHEKQELADAVSAGRLTQAQADALTANLQQRFTDFVNGTHPAFPGGGPGFGHGPADDLAAAASYLGTTASALVTDLQSGKTLAQVADATSGKSASGLIAALVAHEKQELADAVTAGRLTQSQADALSANLQQRVTDLVNGTRPAGRMFGMGGRHGGWGGGGPNA